MNNLIELKGNLGSKKKDGKMGPASIPATHSVCIDKIDNLINSLNSVIEFWKADRSGFPPVVSIYYNRIIPKSLRMHEILSKSKNHTVGVKFSEERSPKHIFTLKTTMQDLTDGISKLNRLKAILSKKPFSGSINGNLLASITDKKDPEGEPYRKVVLKEWKISPFAYAVSDVDVIDRFGIEKAQTSDNQADIITLFDLDLEFSEMAERLGLDPYEINKESNFTWLVTPEQYSKIISKAPFLVSMAIRDIKDYFSDKLSSTIQEKIEVIPNPTDEPTIGVLDTLFDETAYFTNWVEYKNLLDPAFETTLKDKEHGTAISSLIVDGPHLNPELEDGCGRFKVRHFGIAQDGKNSSISIMRKIREIVTQNTDIKVWNLSLGSENPISRNFISPEAALLDQLQKEYDIIFVVSGSNNEDKDNSQPLIGAPADSINSIVVNAVTHNGEIPSYARKGPVLDFFVKPDIVTVGGSDDKQIRVIGSQGQQMTGAGTSYAAPWISRKIAYMIYYLGFSKEQAKALLIDSAIGWNTNISDVLLLGYGKVPLNIKDIVSSANDELRFFVKGIVNSYETYAYNIPVPMTDGKFPYVAKATLCYTSSCSRNNGVDYTDDELDLHLGRIENGKKVISINHNTQGNPFAYGTFEKEARDHFRKWDNVKHVSEGYSENSRFRKAYDDNHWGFVLRAKSRFDVPENRAIRFTLVVTLKSLEKKNRYEEFLKLCSLNRWFINIIEIENRMKIYEKAEETINLEI